MQLPDYLDKEPNSLNNEHPQDASEPFQAELLPKQEPAPAANAKVAGLEAHPKARNLEKAPANKPPTEIQSVGVWTTTTDKNTNLKTLVSEKKDGTKIEIKDLNGQAQIRIHAPFLKEDVTMNDLKSYGYSPDGRFSATNNDDKFVYNNADGSITRAMNPEKVLYDSKVEEETYHLDGRISTERLFYGDRQDRQSTLDKTIRLEMKRLDHWLAYRDKDKNSSIHILQQNDGTKIKTESINNIGTITIHAPHLKNDLILKNQTDFTHRLDGGLVAVAKKDGTEFERLADGQLSSKTSWGLNKTWKTDGTIITQRPYGTVIKETPDGTKTSELFTGHKIIQRPDGSSIIELPDHKQVVWTAANNGLSKDANGTETLSLPDGLKIKHLHDGTDIYEFADGKKVVEFADGRLQRVTPYIDSTGHSIGTLIEQDGPKPGDNLMIDNESARIEAQKVQKRLEDTFHVTFTKANDPPYLGHDGNGHRIERPRRAPTLQELLVIERVLYKSQPNHLFNGQGVTFAFMNGETLGATQAFFEQKNGIVNIPTRDIRDKLDWFQKDDVAYNLSIQTASFEAYMIHELGHNPTQRVNATKGKEYYSENQLATDFGMKQISSPNTGFNPIWVVLGNKQSDGHNYDMYSIYDIGNDQHRASRCDDQGRRVGQESITIAELRQRALVNPATNDFRSPEEMIVEALTCLRLGGKSKTTCIKKSPVHYAKAKELDQDQIDYTYPPNQEHPRGWMRAANGHLVDKTNINLKAVSEFEERARRQS